VVKKMLLINKTQAVCGGNARIRNTRIPVWTLVSLHKMGESDSNLISNFPGLTQADLNEAWVYYQNNTQEIENAILEQGKD
jgi:type III restriction enzyme